MFVGGLRYETTRMRTEIFEAVSFYGEGATESDIDGEDYLPSLNLIYKLRPDMNLRTSYGRTLARPMLREMSPSYFDYFSAGRLYYGNPELTYTRIDNYDLRWEYFLRPGEILAVSGFYKKFHDPIEQVIVGVNGDVQPLNVSDGTVYGAEFEFRRQLDFIGSPLRYFKLGGNFTLVHSEISLTEDELENVRAWDPNADDTRPMAGQSPFIINADLAYDNPLLGTSITLLYNVYGERLSFNQEDGTPNIFEQPKQTLDLISSQRVLGGVKLKFAVKNLLDSETRFTQEFKEHVYVAEGHKSGRTYAFGLSYTFD